MWLTIGLILGAVILFVAMQAKSKGIEIKWYEWLLGVLGLILLLFTVQNIIYSIAEYESAAALMFVLVTGLLAYQLGAIRRRRAASSG